MCTQSSACIHKAQGAHLELSVHTQGSTCTLKAQCAHSELSVHTQGSGCTLRAQCAYTRLSVHTQNSTRVCRVKEENYGGGGGRGRPTLPVSWRYLPWAICCQCPFLSAIMFEVKNVFRLEKLLASCKQYIQ